MLKKIKDFINQILYPTPKHLLERILKKRFTFIDYYKLDHDTQVKMYGDAQMILNSETFNVVVGNIYKKIINEMISSYVPNSNKDVVRDVQMTINGIELLKEELKSIPNPELYNKKR